MTADVGVGARVRELRQARGWSGKRLADEAGVDQAAVWRLEVGESRNPRYETIMRLADALETTVDYLTGRSDGSPVSFATSRQPNADPDLDTLAAGYAEAVERGRAYLEAEAVRVDRKRANYKAVASAPKPVVPFPPRHRTRELYEVQVDGGCMRPLIEPGAVVLVDPTITEWEEGQTVIARYGDAIVCKKAVRRAGRVILAAEDGTILWPRPDMAILGVVVFVPTPGRGV